MNLLGNPLDYLLVFGGGVGVSFSPCVYPLIPVVLGFIGVSASGNKLRGFLLSLVYVSGLALTYSLLGLLAALSGSMFGRISLHPLTRIGVGIIFIFFGLSLWEILPLKTIVLGPRFQSKGKSLGQTFILGVSSGFIISPCTSPVLGAILVYVATKKNLLYGASLLLSFAYGVGFLLILAGTFSAAILSLPKSGLWWQRIKKVGGAILILSGGYFIFTNIIR